MTSSYSFPGRTVLAVFLTTLLASGCNREAGNTALKTAAKVDGAVVSEQALTGTLPQGAEQRTSQQLENLINEQLLANAAVAAKLDTDPVAQGALEEARRGVLARVYIRKQTSAIAKPGEEEVAAYYRAHPELFAQRNVYRLQEIAVQADPGRIAEIDEKFRGLKTFDERAALLKTMGVPFRTGATVKGAEELPSDLLANVAKMPENAAFVLKNQAGATFVQITGIEAQPVSEAGARVSIERFLSNQRLSALLDTETRRLRAAAKVEYVAPHTAPVAAKTTGQP